MNNLSYSLSSINVEGKYFNNVQLKSLEEKNAVKATEASDLLALCFLQKVILEKAYIKLQTIIIHVESISFYCTYPGERQHSSPEHKSV